MQIAEYKLAKQIGEIGYFGCVGLAVEVTDRDGLSIEFSDECSEEWKRGIEFGLSYVWENLPQQYRGLRVNVTKIEGHAVDSTSVVMAFVATQVLWKALKVHAAVSPYLEDSSGEFCFPK